MYVFGTMFSAELSSMALREAHSVSSGCSFHSVQSTMVLSLKKCVPQRLVSGTGCSGHTTVGLVPQILHSPSKFGWKLHSDSGRLLGEGIEHTNPCRESHWQ